MSSAMTAPTAISSRAVRRRRSRAITPLMEAAAETAARNPTATQKRGSVAHHPVIRSVAITPLAQPDRMLSTAVAIAALRGAVEAAVAAREPRIRLEHKPAAVVLHTRGLPDDVLPRAAAIADEAAATPGVTHLAGKGVHELSVLRADKGTALRELASALGVDATVYLGDDVTDEHAFAVLGEGDLGIKVGAGETAASARVDDATAVPEILATLASLR